MRSPNMTENEPQIYAELDELKRKMDENKTNMVLSEEKQSLREKLIEAEKHSNDSIEHYKAYCRMLTILGVVEKIGYVILKLGKYACAILIPYLGINGILYKFFGGII